MIIRRDARPPAVIEQELEHRERGESVAIHRVRPVPGEVAGVVEAQACARASMAYIRPMIVST